MPTSHSEHKQWALEKYLQIKPALTVDIGPGNGTYSDLMRPHFRGAWKAIEAWAPYIPQYNLWQKYDHVIVSDIRHCDLFSVHHGPDLVVIGDCLEHISRPEALFVIKRLKAWADHLIISIPVGDYPQGVIEGNWFEAHQDTWTHQEMLDALGEGTVEHVEGQVLSAYYWSNLK
ncbi:hypothetical protein WKW50_16445 [Ochrobactrum sp. GPK 3]